MNETVQTNPRPVNWPWPGWSIGDDFAAHDQSNGKNFGLTINGRGSDLRFHHKIGGDVTNKIGYILFKKNCSNVCALSRSRACIFLVIYIYFSAEDSILTSLAGRWGSDTQTTAKTIWTTNACISISFSHLENSWCTQFKNPRLVPPISFNNPTSIGLDFYYRYLNLTWNMRKYKYTTHVAYPCVTNPYKFKNSRD